MASNAQKAQKEAKDAQKATEKAETANQSKKIEELEKKLQEQNKQIEELKEKAKNKPSMQKAGELIEQRENLQQRKEKFSDMLETLNKIDADLSESPVDEEQSLRIYLMAGSNYIFKTGNVTVISALVGSMIKQIEEKQNELNESLSKIENYFA